MNENRKVIGTDGRDEKGRFGAGNRASVGHLAPYAAHVQALRASVMRTFTKEAMADVVRAMIDKATRGDVAAAKLILMYGLGKPAEIDDEVHREEISMLDRRNRIREIYGLPLITDDEN
jgi:hypothetical protein